MRRPHFLAAILAAAVLAAAPTLAAPTLVGPVNAAPGLPGGNRAALQVNATGVIRLAPGRLVRIIVLNPGSAGSLTVNDTDTVPDAAAANQIISLTNAQMSAGQQIYLDWPIGTGIVVSAVTTGGVFSIAYN